MISLYTQGVKHALHTLGFKTASEIEEKGTPFPSKSQTINAERFATVLQQQKDDASPSIYPENRRYRQSGKPVSWGHSIDLTGLNQGQPIAGLMLPSNPRA